MNFNRQKMLRMRLEAEHRLACESDPVRFAPMAVRSLVAQDPEPLTLLPGAFKNGEGTRLLRKRVPSSRDPTQCQPATEEDVQNSTIIAEEAEDKSTTSPDHSRKDADDVDLSAKRR